MIIDTTKTEIEQQISTNAYKQSTNCFIMLIQLNDRGIISTKTLCDEMGLDYERQVGRTLKQWKSIAAKNKENKNEILC